MFPIFSENGKVLAFGGEKSLRRIISGNILILPNQKFIIKAGFFMG